MEDTHRIYPPITALEIAHAVHWRDWWKGPADEKRRLRGRYLFALMRNDEWLTKFAQKRPLRYHPWKIRR